MRRRSKILVAATVALCAIAIPIVGPFTFYEEVVPPLSPIITKPDGVPSNARASFNWKGFGLFWEWEKEFDSGCASWGKADDFDYDFLRLIPGNDGCGSVGLALKSDTNSEQLIVFDFGSIWAGGDTCPKTVSPMQIEALKALARDVNASANTQIERKSIMGVLDQLENVDGKALTTEHDGGCSARNLEN